MTAEFADPEELELQPHFAPDSICFGCGPANPRGLGLISRVRDLRVVAQFLPKPEHAAFPGVLAGGIMATLLDCHGNWTAAWELMRREGLPRPTTTVTSRFELKLLAPAPLDEPIELSSTLLCMAGKKIDVKVEALVREKTVARLTGRFVAVRPGHPAYGAW